MRERTGGKGGGPGALAAVVPCYNAGGRVSGVVARVLPHVSAVVLVDDGSTDGSAAGVPDAPGVRRVVLPQNRGKGHALLAGFRAALEDPAVTCVAVLDADGQHDAAELPRLYARFVETNADFLIGARDFSGAAVPWASRFGNVLTVSLSAFLLGRRIGDTQSGYRLHSRRFLEAVLGRVRGGRYETEMELLVRAARGPFRLESLPIQTIYEPGNRSSHFHKLKDSVRVYARLFASCVAVRREKT